MFVNNTEKFIQKAKMVHGNKYDYSETVYINHWTPVKIKCKECGNSFLQITHNHLIGKGCHYCGKKKSGGKVLTTAEFIARAILKHGDKYDYSKSIYKVSKENVEIICKCCGKSFIQTPNRHLAGKGCPTCGKTKPFTTEQFIQKAKVMHGDKYDYSQTNYINANTKVKIFCKRCGKFFMQNPYNHISGNNCLCYKTKTKQEFLQQANLIHKDAYDYSEIHYINTLTKVKIFCKACKKFFMQTPHGHLSGRGCPYCCKSKAELVIKNWLESKNIEYNFQAKFKDCKDKHNLSFDFYLPTYNTCIEYQGKQHFCMDFYTVIRRKYSGKEKEAFELQQKHDQIKRDYCKYNDIKLLEITYNNNIEKVLTEWYNSL